jgi:hypothetical protein
MIANSGQQYMCRHASCLPGCWQSGCTYKAIGYNQPREMRETTQVITVSFGDETMVTLSPQLLIEANWPSHALPDVAAETTAQLDAVLTADDCANRRIAVAVGSRGISQIADVARAAVAFLKSRGALPFVFPGMGSHGGATAAGQRDMLATLGVTEQSVGAPIDDSMETVEVGRTRSGIRVLMARCALEADAILLINRVKPHTNFMHAELGSGVRKMCALGLGKAEGAIEYHRAAARSGYPTMISEVSELVLAQPKPIFGLGLVEDAHHRPARIEAWRQTEIIEREPALLKLAREWMPALPFPQIDVLIVDELGKNISGTGMDTNIIGRSVDGGVNENRRSEVSMIYVRGLTAETHGNAVGMGMADFVSSRLVAQVDKRSTYTNVLTALNPSNARIPMHFDSDAECLQAALRVAVADPAQARVVRVRNTLALDRFVVTANYAAELAKRSDLRIVREAEEWRFTATGDLDPAGDLLAA